MTRFTGHVIDVLLFGAVFIGYVFLIEALFGIIRSGDVARPLGGLVLYFLYFAGAEMLYGRTPGKFMAKTRLVDEVGKKPSPGSVLIRTACRFVPFDTFSFLLDKRGWHDRLSGTCVVHDHVKR